MEKWLGDNSHRIYRFLVYKKLFTPYELDKKFVDESQFEDTNYRFGFIEEAIELGNGEWLLGFREVIDDEVCNYIRHQLTNHSIFAAEGNIHDQATAATHL